MGKNYTSCGRTITAEHANIVIQLKQWNLRDEIISSFGERLQNLS